VVNKGEAVSMSNGDIEILGTIYSPRLRSLFNAMVAATGGKPVEFFELTGHVGSRIVVSPDKINVGLRRGSSEDDVAHEFMHAILSGTASEHTGREEGAKP
jgi:hypothetical protein